MLKLYSHLIGIPITTSAEKYKISYARDLILDPDRGNLVALCTLRGKVIAPLDIGPFKGDFWEVSGVDALLEEEDLVRLNDIPEQKRWLIHKPVITKSGEYLGRVADYVMNMETLSLAQLYVTKKFLFLTTEKRIIQWKEILEITERAIIVKDNQIADPARTISGESGRATRSGDSQGFLLLRRGLKMFLAKYVILSEKPLRAVETY